MSVFWWSTPTNDFLQRARREHFFWGPESLKLSLFGFNKWFIIWLEWRFWLGNNCRQNLEDPVRVCSDLAPLSFIFWMLLSQMPFSLAIFLKQPVIFGWDLCLSFFSWCPEFHKDMSHHGSILIGHLDFRNLEIHFFKEGTFIVLFLW